MKLNEDLKQDLNKLEEYYDLFSKEIREKEKKYKTNLDEYLNFKNNHEYSKFFLNKALGKDSLR